MISIILCTFNGDAYLNQFLKSILQQTRLPDEIIIIDDHSADKTIEIIETFKSESKLNVKLIRNQANIGVIRSFELGLKKTKGNWIFLADQDDVWHPDKIATMYSQSDTAPQSMPLLMYSDARLINNNDELLCESYMSDQRLNLNSHKAVNTLSVINSIPGCTIMINRELLNIALPFPKDVVMHDWWIALAASLSGHIIYQNRSLIDYRVHNHNTWGLDSNNIYQTIIKRFHDRSLIRRLISNYERAIKQCLAMRTHLINKELIIDNEWCQSIDLLSKRGFSRFQPFLKRTINRQGALREFSFFFGAVLTVNKQIKANCDTNLPKRVD